MVTGVTYSSVEEWLQIDRFKSVEQRADKNSDYNFKVNCDGESVHVVKPPEQEYVGVVCEHEFEPEFLSNFLSRPDHEKDEFLSRLQSVLTNAPGKYMFFDDDERPCGFVDDFRVLRFERALFPNDSTRQRLIDTIEQFAFVRKFVGDQEGIYKSQLDAQR